jgi:hypothetical protein
VIDLVVSKLNRWNEAACNVQYNVPPFFGRHMPLAHEVRVPIRQYLAIIMALVYLNERGQPPFNTTAGDRNIQSESHQISLRDHMAPRRLLWKCEYE